MSKMTEHGCPRCAAHYRTTHSRNCWLCQGQPIPHALAVEYRMSGINDRPVDPITPAGAEVRRALARMRVHHGLPPGEQ